MIEMSQREKKKPGRFSLLLPSTGSRSGKTPYNAQEATTLKFLELLNFFEKFVKVLNF